MNLTLNVPVHNATLMEGVHSLQQLPRVLPDQLLWQARLCAGGQALQGALITVLHEHQHLILCRDDRK